MCRYFFNERGADLRHTSLGSPQAIIKYGMSAPYGAVPILMIALSRGGD
jgi:hypothetical protein